MTVHASGADVAAFRVNDDRGCRRLQADPDARNNAVLDSYLLADNGVVGIGLGMEVSRTSSCCRLPRDLR